MKNLKKLSEFAAPSGFERKLGEYLSEEFKRTKSVKSVYRDRIGNIYAEIPGKSKRKMIVAAHMDEIGLMVNYISDKGFIKFITIGGIVADILPNTLVRILGEKKEILGVIGVNPPHAASSGKKEIKDLFIDTGLTKEKIEKAGIGLGTPIVFETSFSNNDNVYIGKAFDDRIGCAVLLHIAQEIKKVPDYTILLVASVQEEVGTRGAQVVSLSNEADCAVIFEGTFAMDYPGNSPDDWTSYFGGGPAFTLMDGTMVSDRGFIKEIENIAQNRKIKYQYKQPRNAGGTDAGKLHLSKNGMPCAVIAAPCRYIHSSYSLLNKHDYESMKKLGVVICEDMKSEIIEKIF
ncbi:MAG: M28 family peptidase [Candidatus Muirbacterium halophilum]|nr:M28 family peptidase [Candidatus Muirbacterium halophilum]MCK9475355.1 M28 family peptidase [Candidatus Muirbacterium halophilum]